MNANLIEKNHVEKINPFLRKKLRPFKFAIKNSDVTVWGLSFDDAKKRFRVMTGGEVAFIPVNTKANTKRKIARKK